MKLELNSLFLTEDSWEPFSVGDVLYFSDDDASYFLEEDLIGPGRVDCSQRLGDAIVLTHPQGVHHSQLRLLIDSRIPGVEAGIAGARTGNG